MLTQLNVKNLAIAEEIAIDFNDGMHVITGETGAGKSIILDALGLVLGDRAASEMIRAGQNQAEITASFDISKLPRVQALIDDQCECIIRRVINVDGRSKAYINGISASVQQLKSLSPHLVQMHSQHQHHALLQNDFQRQMLDEYAAHYELQVRVAKLFDKWSDIKQEISKLESLQQSADRLDLLSYQLHEFDNLDLQDDEITTLNVRHKQLSKATDIVENCNIAADAINADSGIIDQLHRLIAKLDPFTKDAEKIRSATKMLNDAIIHLQEGSQELNNFANQLDLDAEQLHSIEQRLSAIHNLARKLRIDPNNLFDHMQRLRAEHARLSNSTQELIELQTQLQITEDKYLQAATELTTSRSNAAQKFAKAVIKRLQTLEMPQVKLLIDIETSIQISPNGLDKVNFCVSTNPGLPPAPLKKIASGGELSRISLAIQVIAAERMATPTLVMDEVDVGISGKTAATVGALMRELSANAQIICITHLPQVASQAHIHFKVTKNQSKSHTSTQIYSLERPQRLQELARLLGGTHITEAALANAESLLATV